MLYKFPIAIFLVVVCVGVTQLMGNANKSSPKTTTLTFFYTGELAGEIEPCGCSGTKTGGLLIRSGWIDNLAHPQTTYLVDGGFATPNHNRQAAIKFAYHHRILQHLDYHYRFLSSQEMIPGNLKLEKQPVLLGYGRKSIPWYHVRETKVGKLLVIAMEKQDQYQHFAQLVGKIHPKIVWVMTKGLQYPNAKLVPEGNFFTVVFPVDSQEPFSPVVVAKNIIIISAGNRGRYAGQLHLDFTGNKFSDWQNKTIFLNPEYPPNRQVKKFIEQYKAQVKSERLLDFQLKEISPVGFVGSEMCLECHEEEYDKWKVKDHAHAFDILVQQNYHHDPECVGCHVVGYKYEEGFRNLEESEHLIHVGCEECHGAGAKHVMDPQPGYGRTNGEQLCLICHTQTRSPHFDYDKYLNLIIHWEENDYE